MYESISFKPLQASLSEPERLSFGSIPAMSAGERIRRIRKEADLTQEGLAERLSAHLPEDEAITRGAIGNWERGQGIKRANLELIARVFSVSFEWLATGRGNPRDGQAANAVQILGYVGAGAEVVPFDDNPMGQGIEEVEIDFPVPDGTAALIVRGDSMLPVFEDGDLIGYMRDERPPEELLKRTCVVKIADGRILIKKIMRGSGPGLYTLWSANAAPIEDVVVEWAMPYRFHIPRDAWK